MFLFNCGTAAILLSVAHGIREYIREGINKPLLIVVYVPGAQPVGHSLKWANYYEIFSVGLILVSVLWVIKIHFKTKQLDKEAKKW